MSRLDYRQQKIQEKRKKTPWRQFVMEICSWYVLNLYKVDGKFSRYPNTGRKPILVTKTIFDQEEQSSCDKLEDFFYSFSNLFLQSKLTSTMVYGENPNSEYSEAVFGAKNAYLSFSVGIDAENMFYTCSSFSQVRNVINSLCVEDNSQNIYYAKSIQKSNKVFFSKYITACNDIWFSTNLIGCNNCLFCDGLINQQYCINNVVLSKEDYESKRNILLTDKALFEDWYIKLSDKGKNYSSENVTGSGIIHSEDIQNGFLCRDMKQGKNLVIASGGDQGSRNFYDGFDVGVNCNDFYAVCGAGNSSQHIYCSANLNNSYNCYYSIFINDCSFCLGCIGLKNKSYCILNKQYTKEERYAKVDEIFAQMEKIPHPDPLLAGEGENALGAFFPATMNPFYFNDTAAYLIDPSFTKEEVTARGYLRRDEPIKVDIPAGVQTVKTSELDQYEGWKSPLTPLSQRGESGVGQQRRIDPEIMKKVILDEQGNAYRIIPMEYEFLMKYGLPLPRKHWLERMKENFRIQ